jgi:hypothetical protein
METKNGYYDFIKPLKVAEKTIKSQELPHEPASEKTLFNLALTELYQECNEDCDLRGIEIGVLNGETSRHLLSLGEYIRLIGIDPIIPDSMETSLIGSLEFIRQNTDFAGERWEFLQDYSYDVHSQFVNESVDFLFIDGDHTYDAVRQDYELYFPKIRKGGLIFFHDSRMNRGGAPFHVGSSKFVDELIDDPNLPMDLIGEAFSLTCFKKK